MKNLDFGLRQLWPQWKALLTTRDLKEDTLAGLTVACVAIPLSLAIGLACGVDPEVGLVTSVVAGLVSAFFGGTPLSVSGPTLTMAVLIGSVGETYGLAGIILVGLGCGILQLLSGLLGFGKFVRYMPMPVISGFTAGIGAVIFIGQLPRALGLPPPPESQTLSVLTHIFDYVHMTNFVSLGLAAGTMATIFGLSRLWPRIPATLVGVFLATLVSVLFGLDTKAIGAIPNHLPMPKFPSLPAGDLIPLLTASFTALGLASLETLLSSTAVDKLTRKTRHDPDQELVGQGLGNIVTSLFGGLPGTGVIARTALNVQAGARTRRSSMIHSLALLLTITFASPLIAKIPIAALAGVLLVVAWRMLNWRDFFEVTRVAKAEGAVYALTFLSIVGFDLLVGIQVGVMVALLITAVRAAHTGVDIPDMEEGVTRRISLSGALTFLSSPGFERVRDSIEAGKARGSKRLVIEMKDVTQIDATAAETLISIVRDSADTKVILHQTPPRVRLTLVRADHGKALAGRMTVSEVELDHAFSEGVRSALSRLMFGVHRFRKQKEERYQDILSPLAAGQSPHTLFVTCADSRINPALMTSTEPGELFVIRNVGNTITPFTQNSPSSEQGGIEYALNVLKIREIVICGHTSCGAMNAISERAELDGMPGLKRYLGGPAFAQLRMMQDGNADDFARANTLAQLENLKTYPGVLEMLLSGELKVHLWIYDLKRADLDQFNLKNGRFEAMIQPLKPASVEGLA